MGFDQRAMRDMMKQAQQMQAQMEKAQQNLAEETVEGSSGGGMVTATMTGQIELQSITISKDVVDPEDVEMLQDLVLSALKDAIEKAKALQGDRLGAITGGMNLPF
ncbi:MAG: YbaB/EbfC family nucleoid-associated protein [Chloroflexi bacterium]|jgi:DNA-binding YbaB/EbfC family protein|nr:YbaB/EbfC family nucleoid-associated protein [Chloroflexota bacterium]MDB5075670.1 YbaB/EbfC family nucleoid-associated protein [Chloroflexota bacterium]